MNHEAKAIKEATKKRLQWERAFAREIEALKRVDAAKSNPDGRARHMARVSLRAARRNMERVETNT